MVSLNHGAHRAIKENNLFGQQSLQALTIDVGKLLFWIHLTFQISTCVFSDEPEDSTAMKEKQVKGVV